jgi:hypothetical protein
MTTPRFLVGCAVALLCSALLAGSMLARSPRGRFVPYAPTMPVALDTVTARACWAGIEGTQARDREPLPICARLWSGTTLGSWR